MFTYNVLVYQHINIIFKQTNLHCGVSQTFIFDRSMSPRQRKEAETYIKMAY